MSGHTKGPWKVVKTWSDDPISEQHEIFSVESADGSLNILVDGSYFYQDEKDARLIAAAPDLLDALESIILNASPKLFSVGQLAQARAAIAKAKGEAQ